VLSALDDGGTPFDKTDDRWLHDGDIPGYVGSIAQDSSGILWISHGSAGASAFDPGPDPFDTSDDRWYQFTTSNSGLAGSVVFKVAADDEGYIWFVTNNGGASVLDYRDDPFDPDEGGGDLWQTFVLGMGVPNNHINDIAIDGAGNKWFVSWSRVSVLDTGASPFDPADDNWLVFDEASSTQCIDEVLSIAVDGAGNKWFGGYDCVSVLDTGPYPTDGITDTWHTFTNIYLEGEINVVFPDGDNLVWFGPETVLDEEGMSVLDHGGDPFDGLNDDWAGFTPGQGLYPYNKVTSMAAGSGGLTWFGQRPGGGLRVLDPMGTPTDSTDDQWADFGMADGLPSDAVDAVAVDQAGIVWFGTYGHIGVLDHGGSPLDKSDDIWATVESIAAVFLYPKAIAVDDDNLKWITGQGQFPFYPPELLVLDDNDTPITTTDDITMIYGSYDGLTAVPKALAVDGTGIKWLTALTEGYVQALYDGGTPFDKGDDEWVTFSTTDGLLDGGSGHQVTGVAVDEQDRIWITVEGDNGGVSVLDYNGTITNTVDDTWHSYQTVDGLLSGTVRGVVIDEAGDKWFAMPSGVSRLDDGGDPFDGLNDTWQTYTTAHGLVFDDILGVYMGGDGRVWAGLDPIGAAVAVPQSAVLWSTEEAVDHLPAEGITQTLTVIPGLDSTGRYKLKAAFLNDLGQTLALDRVPFYVEDEEAALTLDAVPDPVQPGGVLTVTVTHVNLGITQTLTNQTVTLTQDGQVIATEGPFDVPAGGSYAFDVVTAAPASGSATVLSASSSDGLRTNLRVTLARPVIAANVSVPAVVSTDPFSLTVQLTNSGDAAGQVGVSFGGLLKMVEAPAGGTALVKHEAQVCGHTDLAVMLTGDLTGTLTVPVIFGPQVEATFDSPPVAPLGIIEIPYLLTNTGSLDVEVTALYTVTGSPQESFDTFLAAGASVDGDRIIEVATGAQTLYFALKNGTCSLAGGQVDFIVAPAISATITVTAGIPGAQVPVTATLSSTGMAPYSGTLQLKTDDGYRVDSPVSLAVGATKAFTFSLEAASILTGTRLVTVTAVTDAGDVVAQGAGSFTLLGPMLQLSSLPTTTVLPAGETVTLTFGVTNQGDQDGTAELSFTLGDLADEAQVRVVSAGETAYLEFVFYVPPEMETKEYLAIYDLNDEQGELALTIQGISLTVEAGGDQLAYREGDPVTFILTVTNQLATTVPDLFALVSLGEITATQPFTMTAAPASLTFPFTATFGSGGVVFYGIYHEPSERGVHLNTFRLAQQQPAVTVLLDREVYFPADMVEATVVTTTTGELELTAPGYTGTLALTGSHTGFDFTLPTTMDRGTYAVDYRLTGCDCEHEGRQYQAWFDVAAPKVRVIESQLDHNIIFPGDTLELRLTVASDTPVNVVLRSYLVYPDGSQGGTIEKALSLDDRLDNLGKVSALITSTQAGLAFFHYDLVDAADETLVRAAGVEAFDLGTVTLVGVATDRTEYLTATLPVTATVQLYASQAVTGDLALTLNGSPPQMRQLALSAGSQSVSVRLDGPITPGHRALTATFSFDSMVSQLNTTFDYGTSLPDLVPSLPSLVPGPWTVYVPTRTLTLIVSNQGVGASASTQAAIYDESSGGVLIGTAAVPSLEPNQQATVGIVWDVAGEGGDHLLKVVVDPVDEFDTVNNTIEGEVTLPRLASNLALGSSSISAGENLAMQVSLENLQDTATLPLTATLRVYAPISGSVYTETWTLTLDGGEQCFLDAQWASPSSAETGLYFIEAEITDAFGEHHLHRTFFIVQAQPVMPVVADFSATPTSGPEPLLVTFTNLSSGEYDTCLWEFGDGDNISDCDDPDHEYISPGVYSVNLTVSGLGGADNVSKTNYITVYQQSSYIYIPLVMNG